MTFSSLETPWGSQRRERRYPPLGALSLFGFTLAIFLCQVSPIPGVAMMMLGAPFWSVATINLGMLSLVVEALLGITWRWVLIVPLLYFGGYEACAVVSHVQLARLQGEIGRSNSATHLAFDSAAERLGGKDLTPLLVRYGLPAVYEPNGATDGPAWRALRLARTATCRQLTTASTAHADYHGSDTCIVSSAETPDLPMVVVSSSVTTPRLQGLHDVEIETVTMTRPDGASVATRAGHAAALGWFPAPVLGCALMSTTRWGCQAGFMFADRAPLVRELKQYEGRQEAMARALGLAAVAPRVEQTDAQARSLVTAANEDAIVRDLARLHAFMDDPDARTPAFFSALTNRPETLSPLRHQIVAAMAEAAMGGIRQRERVSDLVSLGAVFTPDDIRDVGPQLIPALAIAAGTARPTYPAPISSVVERLGDAGPTAVPLLEKLLFDRENGQAAAIALCRIGAPAASAVDALEALAASEPIADNYFPGRATAATLALARLGRGDLALSHVPPPSAMQHGSLFHFDHFRGLRDRVAAMSSSSPPWFCSYNDRSYPRPGDPPEANRS